MPLITTELACFCYTGWYKGMTVVLLVMKTNCLYSCVCVCVFGEYNSVCDGTVFFIFQECGNRRTLPFCQYVDGPHIIFGCLFYHASFCKYISFIIIIVFRWYPTLPGSELFLSYICVCFYTVTWFGGMLTILFASCHPTSAPDWSIVTGWDNMACFLWADHMCLLYLVSPDHVYRDMRALSVHDCA